MTAASDVDTGTGLCARGLGVRLGGVAILSDVDVSIARGAVTGIVGPSGSGKTTLLRALAGLVPLSSGTLAYDGARRARPGNVALLAQHPRLVCNPRWTLRRIVGEPAAIAGRRPDLVQVAARVGLDDTLLDRWPAQVSDGQLQRACVARILVQCPDHVLCDEPTAMLDPIAARAILGVLDELVGTGVGMALVSHNERLVMARAHEVVRLGNRDLHPGRPSRA